jgi:7-carboxy-7-deazaguanine synthase
MNNLEGKLVEIFSSFQGEGLYLGERQLFIRFAGCNLSCQYCDTPQALEVPPRFKIEDPAGTRKFEQLANPVTVPSLIALLNRLDKPSGIHSAITLTGGEPLLQVDFLLQLLPEIKKSFACPIYLETNGVLPDHLGEIIELVDIIAFDIKLPSATGLTAYWKEHRKALEIAYLKEVFIKIVFTKESLIKELDEAVALIAAVDENIPLVLQPVTPHGAQKNRPSIEEMFAWDNVARRKLKRVRLIPQAHKLSGLL